LKYIVPNANGSQVRQINGNALVYTFGTPLKLEAIAQNAVLIGRTLSV